VPCPDQLLEGIGRRCERTHRKGRVGCTELKPKMNLPGDRAAVHSLASFGGR
jgi:hypothetical protein